MAPGLQASLRALSNLSLFSVWVRLQSQLNKSYISNSFSLSLIQLLSQIITFLVFSVQLTAGHSSCCWLLGGRESKLRRPKRRWTCEHCVTRGDAVPDSLKGTTLPGCGVMSRTRWEHPQTSPRVQGLGWTTHLSLSRKGLYSVLASWKVDFFSIWQE